MATAYTGGSACGAIRYEISAEPMVMNDCQCRDCQRRSGTGHGSYLTFASRADRVVYDVTSRPPGTIEWE